MASRLVDNSTHIQVNSSSTNYEPTSFPKVRVIEFLDTSSSNRIFEKAQIELYVNLIFHKNTECYLPRCNINTIEVREGCATIHIGDQARTYAQGLHVVTPYDIKVDCIYGDDPKSAKEEYFQECNFESDPDKNFTSECKVKVIRSGHTLGTITFVRIDDPFTAEVWKAKDSIVWNGNVPEKWSHRISPKICDIFKQLASIEIKGSVGARAFEKLEIDCESLIIGGTIGDDAFNNTSGSVKKMSVKETTFGWCGSCELYIHHLTVSEVKEHTEPYLTADIVEISNGKHARWIENANTIIITNTFDLPVRVGASIMKVDFSRVKSSGPFVVEYPDTRIVRESADIVYRHSDLCMSIFKVSEAYEQLVRQARSSFPDDKFEIKFNGVTYNDDTYNTHGIFIVRIGSNEVIRCHVVIDNFFTGLLRGIFIGTVIGFMITLAVVV